MGGFTNMKRKARKIALFLVAVLMALSIKAGLNNPSSETSTCLIPVAHAGSSYATADSCSCKHNIVSRSYCTDYWTKTAVYGQNFWGNAAIIGYVHEHWFGGYEQWYCTKCGLIVSTKQYTPYRTRVKNEVFWWAEDQWPCCPNTVIGIRG